MSNKPLKPARRILFVRLGAIGDVLRVLPALARVRRDLPDAQIGWAVEHWVAPVLKGHPDIARLHVLDRRQLKGGARAALAEMRRHAAEIRSHNYDVSLDFHGLAKSGLVPRLSRIPARIGYDKNSVREGNHLFNNIHVSLEDRWENRISRFLHLLEPLGVATDYDPGAHGLYLPPDLAEQARQTHADWGGPELALYPGTSQPRADERWPSAKWIQLVGRLAGRGIRSVVYWGPSEEELAADIVAGADTAACRLAPPTTLMEMMAQIGCFAGFVGSDTAAMHMAWMQGVPTAVFLGYKPLRTATPMPPLRWRGLRADQYVMEGRSRRRQPPEIVGAVPVDEAFDAALYILGTE